MTSAYLSPVVSQIGDILSIIRAKLNISSPLPPKPLEAKCASGNLALRSDTDYAFFAQYDKTLTPDYVEVDQEQPAGDTGQYAGEANN